MASKNRISSVTRRDIFDYIVDRSIAWSGRLDEIEFLYRLYDLDALPSFDSRFGDAESDIIQHRRANLDWPDYWIFEDERFDLVDGSDGALLKFLSEIVHPEVRSDQSEVETIVTGINKLLGPDGYELYASGTISGRKVFEYREIIPKELSPQSETQTSSPPSCWQCPGLRLFVSHLSKDKIEISELKTELLNWNILAFVAHEDIEPTKEWEKEIESALHTMDAMLVFLTNDFKGSNWTGQEIGFAVCRRVPIIPIRRGTDPYGFIGRIQGLNPKSILGYSLAKEIVLRLHSNPSVRTKILDAMISKFETSESFAEAKSNFLSLKEFAGYTPAQLIRIERVQKENRQVEDCWYVRDHMRGFIQEAHKVSDGNTNASTLLS